MPVASVRASSSTWVRETAPNTSYATSQQLSIAEGPTGHRGRAFLYFAPKISTTAVVSSAILTIYLVGPSSSWGAVSVRRCTTRIADANKTWNNQPSVGGVQGTPVTPSGTVADGTAITFDLTSLVQQWVAGNLPNYGIEIQNAGSTPENIYGALTAHPASLQITYATPPDTPHNLAPNGVAGLAKPTVTFGPFTDVDGDSLQAVQVQVASTSTGFSTPTFDSGWVSSTVPQLDLSTTSFAGFTGTAQFWRVRVEDASGQVSAWSDPASVTYVAKPVPVLSSPSAATPHVFEATPQIVWSSTSMTSWKVQILDGTTRALLADSGHVAGTVGQWGVPANVIQPGGSYIAAVYTWDQNRAASPGDTAYGYTEQAFTFTPGTNPAPTGVTVTQGTDWPGQVLVTWSDAAAPDYFTVYMDGKVVTANLAPGTALVSGTTYRAVIDNCPNGAHTFQVDAVTSGVATVASTAVSYTQNVLGVWLGDPVRKIWVQFEDTQQSPDQWIMADQASITPTIDGLTPQLIIRGMGGLAGTCAGLLVASEVSATAATSEANLMLLKGTPQATLRLVAGDVNIPVKAYNISKGPASISSAAVPVRTASFSFFQCDEFPFKALL